MNLTYMCGNRWRARNTALTEVVVTYDVYQQGESAVLRLPARGAYPYSETLFATNKLGTTRLLDPSNNKVLVTKAAGSLWHMFRRVWATERKDLPLKDVAAVGGWRDTSTLLRYQQPDDRTMRAVVDFERPPERVPPPEQAVSNSRSYSLTRRKKEKGDGR